MIDMLSEPLAWEIFRVGFYNNKLNYDTIYTDDSLLYKSDKESR